MPDFQFIEEGHKYLLGNVRLPSVTQVLMAEGFIDSQWFTDEGRVRGQYAHDACLYLDKGTLDEDSVDPVIRPYLDAYSLFKQENGFEPMIMEKPMYHPTYLYGLKPDRTGTVNWLDDECLWDFKTGQPHPATILQMSAYKEGLKANGHPVKKCFVLYLKADGKYKVDEIEVTRQTVNVFLSALACFNWKNNHRR